MFLCEKCHENSGCNFLHFTGSFGPCEDCGKTTTCVDCLTYKARAAEKLPAAEPSGEGRDNG